MNAEDLWRYLLPQRSLADIKTKYENLRKNIRESIAKKTAAVSNPEDRIFARAAGMPAAVVPGITVPATGSCIMPVENLFMTPAVIITGVERSWYPSGLRRRVWLPADRPGMVARETPHGTSSI